jgi:type IV pilus assembly protein PilB
MDTKENKTPLKMGELLVKEGYLKKEDIQKALSIQRKEQEIQKLPLGQIFVKTGALSESDLEDVLSHPSLRKNIGGLALENGLITETQLESCLRKKDKNQLTGELLIEEGFITHQDLEDLLKIQVQSSKIGELAVKLRLISEKDLNDALRIQKSSRKLGEILCDLGLLNPLDLNNVLTKYNKQLKIGDILLDLGYIDKEKLNIAIRDHQCGTKSLEEILLRKKFITPEELQSAIAKQHNIPFRDMTGFVYNQEEKKTLANIISQKYAEKNLVLPISLKDNELTLAFVKPKDMVHTVYELNAMYGHFKISCIMITEKNFEELFEVFYSKHLGNKSFSDKQGIETHGADIDFMEINLDEEFKKNKSEGSVYGTRDIEAEELVNFILKYGIINGASDVHIEQDRQGVKLRYRLDGILREASIGWLNEKFREKISAIISRIKVMASLDIAEKRLPQDGVFRINYYDKTQGKKFDLDFRVATCRGIIGENVTIRILDPRKANVGLENLNHSPHVLEPFKKLLKSSAGMVLVCGPTGSGKSSTLYAALQYLYSPGIKIITAEDPIEYNFPGIMQAQINSKINLTFSRLLRSFLRLDPDVILVGEMRDEETSKIGFDAAQTGHLLLSTLHTNDSISAISRLLDLDVEYGQIASCLMCVLAQRLVRKICPFCVQEYIPDKEEWEMLFQKYPAHLRFYRGFGCEECNFTGYKGRVLLSEIFVVDNEISQALNKGLNEELIKKMAIESGMKTMLDDGLLKLDKTTLSEIIRMVPHDMLKAFRSRDKAQDEADALIESMLSGGSSGEVFASPDSFTLSNPEVESTVIDLIRNKYETLRVKKGNVSEALDPLLFKEFITASFYKICEKSNCKSVTFNIEGNNGMEKINISATPNL